MDTKNEKWLKRARRKALRMQRLMKFVFRHGLGGYHLSKAGRERSVDTRHGPVRVLEYGFEEKELRPLYVDLHGGGFIMMQADADEAMNLEFVRRAGVKVISIDYPKAPQAPFPVAVEAVHDVIAHYLEHAQQYGIETAHMGIGGHSAGGNLATVTCLRDLANGEFGFAYQVMDYPVLDLATPPEQKPRPKGCIDPKEAAMYNACYILPHQAGTLSASPALAEPGDLRGMPPALLLVCGGDSLHDEALHYARSLRAAGVAVTVQEYPDQPHGFTYYKPNADTRDAIERMAGFIAEHSHPV